GPSRQWRIRVEWNGVAAESRGCSSSESSGLFEPALSFGTIDPERIQFGNLVQKSFLRGDRNDHSAVAQKNGLTQLKVPVTQGQALALERGQGKIGPFEEIEHRLRVGRPRS